MDLLDWIFIISAIVFFSSIICVFILTANDKEIKVKIFGIILFIMIFPLIFVLIKYSIIGDLRFIIFLSLILSYLVIEFLLDQVFKIDFRSKLSRHVPYIIVEWTACFSFLFGALRLDYIWGWIVSVFFFAFIIALIYNIAKRKIKK
jgi:hypothetical protein